MKFIQCSRDVLDKVSGCKFSDIPDFFWSKPFTELYFDCLADCAAENPEAAERLHYVAEIAVAALNKAAYTTPKQFQPIAMEDFLWPGFISKHPDVAKSNKELMDEIRLGKNPQLTRLGKHFRWIRLKLGWLGSFGIRLIFSAGAKTAFVPNESDLMRSSPRRKHCSRSPERTIAIGGKWARNYLSRLWVKILKTGKLLRIIGKTLLTRTSQMPAL